jgi:segregation and condensation protein A
MEEKPVPVVRLHHVTVDAVTVAETVVSLAQRLPRLGRLSFRDVTAGLTTRIEIIVHFLAVLELCKLGRVTLGQGTTFGELEIEWIAGEGALDIERIDVYEG